MTTYTDRQKACIKALQDSLHDLPASIFVTDEEAAEVLAYIESTSPIPGFSEPDGGADVRGEREEFEHWITTEGGYDPVDMQTRPDDVYVLGAVEEAWLAWQGRAPTAAQAVATLTEREQFATWASTKGMDLTPFEETFDSDFTSNAWDGWHARALLAAAKPVSNSVPLEITPNTLGGFRGAFYVTNKRAPTEQEVFDAGVKSGMSRVPVSVDAVSDKEKIAGLFLQDADSAALYVFHNQCEDSDADGYTERAEMMDRLAELGVVQRLSGRGRRFGVTAFGYWLIEAVFAQDPLFPLRTIAEHNARETAGHALYLKEAPPHSTAWVELPRNERESWRRKATPPTESTGSTGEPTL